MLQFIARAANLPRGRINHNQRPHTSACHATRHKHPSSRRSTVLIDTPGFNSTGGDDTVVLERIGSYLAETYAEFSVYIAYIFTTSCQGASGAVLFR